MCSRRGGVGWSVRVGGWGGGFSGRTARLRRRRGRAACMHSPLGSRSQLGSVPPAAQPAQPRYPVEGRGVGQIFLLPLTKVATLQMARRTLGLLYCRGSTQGQGAR